MQYSSWRGTNILERFKRTWKAALKSGKIKKVVSSDIIQKRSCENFWVFLESEKSAENWSIFEKEEEAFRHSVASKPRKYNTFI